MASTNLEKFRKGLRKVESGGNYNAQSPDNGGGLGRATGAYQYLNGTWNHHKGYHRAMDAPKSVQDAKARSDLGGFYKRYGRWDLVAVAWHAGQGTADKVKKNPSALNGVGDINISTKEYVKRVLSAAGLKANSGSGGSGGGGGGDDRKKRGSGGGGGGTRRRPWQLPRNSTGKGGRIRVDVHEMHRLNRSLTGHLAVLESVRRRSSDVGAQLDGIVLDNDSDARRIRRALDTALSNEYGVGRARNLLVRDIGYVVEARERALGADRTDRDERRVIERLIASLTPEGATVATRRKVRRLLRGLYEPASGGSGGSGGKRGSGGSKGSGDKKESGKGKVRDVQDVDKGTLWGGSRAPFTQLITPFLAQQGLRAGSGKRSTQNTASGNVSDHYTGNKNAYARDYPTYNGVGPARKLAKKLGINNWQPNSYDSSVVKIGGRKFRVQILFGAGIDHADHIHVGVKRV